MSSILSYLVNAGGPLIFGATAILLVGWLGTKVLASPISRQRFGELSMLACVVWLFSPIYASWIKDRADSIGGSTALVRQPKTSDTPAVSEPAAQKKIELHDLPLATGQPSPSFVHDSASEDSTTNDANEPAVSKTLGPSPVNDSTVADVLVAPPQARVENSDAARPPASVTQGVTRVAESDRTVEGNLIADRPARVAPFLARIYLVGGMLALAWLLFAHILLARLVRPRTSGAGLGVIVVRIFGQ